MRAAAALPVLATASPSSPVLATAAFPRRRSTSLFEPRRRCLASAWTSGPLRALPRHAIAALPCGAAPCPSPPVRGRPLPPRHCAPAQADTSPSIAAMPIRSSTGRRCARRAPPSLCCQAHPVPSRPLTAIAWHCCHAETCRCWPPPADARPAAAALPFQADARQRHSLRSGPLPPFLSLPCSSLPLHCSSRRPRAFLDGHDQPTHELPLLSKPRQPCRRSRSKPVPAPACLA